MGIAAPFGSLSGLLREHAQARPDADALRQDDRRVTYGELDRAMDRVAAGLQRQGVARGDRVAICAANSIDYALVMLGTLRAGGVPALIPPSVTDAARAAMIADSGA